MDDDHPPTQLTLLDLGATEGAATERGRSSPHKLAQRLAGTVERSIVAAGWPVGAFVGSERELMERYGVGRATFREAVRILENHQVATMRVGRGGGLVVTRPEPSLLSHTAALYLDAEGATPAQLHETRVGIELTAVGLVIERLDDGAITALREELRREQTQLESPSGRIDGHAFHLLLASLSQNPVLRLFEQVLIEVRLGLDETQIVVDPPAGPRDYREFASRSLDEHRRIVDAVVARDVVAAEDLLRAHLGAVAAVRTPRV